MSKRVNFLAITVTTLAASLLLSSCGSTNVQSKSEYQMGEKIVVGPLTYNVIETTWRSQLGDEFKVRIPEQRFLVITISVTNGGGHEVSVPLLMLENQNGDSFRELENGEGVDGWFGFLRTIGPAQTQQGRIIFDVPLSSYKLRLTDGGDPATEKYAWVKIDLRMDGDLGVEAPGSSGTGRPVK
jgi:Domain of unknown function (DUF4352)